LTTRHRLSANLAQTSKTSGGHSVGVVRLRTKKPQSLGVIIDTKIYEPPIGLRTLSPYLCPLLQFSCLSAFLRDQSIPRVRSDKHGRYLLIPCGDSIWRTRTANKQRHSALLTLRSSEVIIYTTRFSIHRICILTTDFVCFMSSSE
jgi:hypothetical protein